MDERSISDAIIRNDRNGEINKWLSQKTKHIEIKRTTNDMKRSILICYDEHDQPFFESEFEFFASFQEQLSVFCWSWGLAYRISENYTCVQMLQYILRMKEFFSPVHTIITSARSHITETMQVDINIAIGLSIIKMAFTMPWMESVADSRIFHFLLLFNEIGLRELYENRDKPEQ